MAARRSFRVSWLIGVVLLGVFVYGLVAPHPDPTPGLESSLGECGVVDPSDTVRPAASHLDWFTGWGSYRPRTHCVVTAEGEPDLLWIGILIALAAAVIAGYVKIVWFWRRAYMAEESRYRNRKLMQLAYIFAWCAVCGYLSAIVMFVWPGYRMLAIALAVLTWVTWEFARDLDGLRTSLSAVRLEAELDRAIRERTETLERQVAERTRELEAERARADRASEAKSTFLANMSHEIRTPMTAVLGFAEVVARDDVSDAERREAAETILSAGNHLAELVDNVLDISRVEAGKLALETRPIEVRRLIRDVVSIMAHRAEAGGIEVSCGIDDDLPQWMEGDAMRLRQVLLNLIGNAMKFTKDGGVRVSARLLRTGGDDAIRISVFDSGEGMSPEQLARVFRPFEQADLSTTRRFGGTGLGLAISRGIVRAMGGEIRVESHAGVGSTFWFEIPCVPCDAPDYAQSSTCRTGGIATVGEGSAGRVLVVDDGIDNRRLFRHFLSKAGYVVDEATTGAEAVRLCHEAEGRFDLILMDLHMPVMDGYAATRTIRVLDRATPILAITADARAEVSRQCEDQGFTGVLTKPIARDDLLRECRDAIGRRAA